MTPSKMGVIFSYKGDTYSNHPKTIPTATPRIIYSTILIREVFVGS
jgi:hypothetical protein